MVENLDVINQFEDADEESTVISNQTENITKILNQSYESDEDDDFYEEDDEDDIPSDIGENEPGMVPTNGPNCQVINIIEFFHSFYS
jgi:hypothetical protein